MPAALSSATTPRAAILPLLARKGAPTWSQQHPPRLALFKPYWMVEGENFTFAEDDEAAAVDFWRKRERLHRFVLENKIPDLQAYLAARDRRNRI